MIDIDSKGMRFKFIYDYAYLKVFDDQYTRRDQNMTKIQGSLTMEGQNVTALIEKGTQTHRVQIL